MKSAGEGYTGSVDYVKMRGVASKAEFLGKLEIFRNLGPEELEALAAITDEYEFEHGAPIVYQRDVANSLYIVRSGRLYAQRLDSAGLVRHSHDYLPGAYFQDTWLFKPEVHPETVRASGKGRILVIPGDKFLTFLEQNGIAIERLVLSSQAEEEAYRSRVALPGGRAQSLRLLPDELVKYEERRSRWLLLLREVVPVFLTFAVPVGVSVLLGRVLTGHWLNIALPFLLFIIFGFWAFFVFLDWYNDFFVVTTKHLVRREFDLRTFAAKVNKTPIDQVQSVEVDKPGLIATLFNIGTARITTASQAGIIYFDFIDDPSAVRDAINEAREWVRALDAGRVQATMRQSLEGHFQAPPPLHKISEGMENRHDGGTNRVGSLPAELATQLWLPGGGRAGHYLPQTYLRLAAQQLVADVVDAGHPGTPHLREADTDFPGGTAGFPGVAGLVNLAIRGLAQ
jgi:CRP-like cAMP-binding protein